MSRSGKPNSDLMTADLLPLPGGWSCARLGDIADITSGLTKGQRHRPGTELREVPYLRVANVQRGFLDLATIALIAATKDKIQTLRLQAGDVLFTEGGDRDKLGRGWVWNGEIEECIHQNHIFRARLLSPDIDPKFVSFHGNSFGQDWFLRNGKQTTNLASINQSVLRRFPVPIPPSAEQRRIVAKIEELFSDLDAGVAALERAKANLKRYRAAVLKAAVEGKLTAEWRAKHLPKESASKLLERILTERRKKWEHDQLAAYEAKGKQPPKNWREKYQEPAGPDTTNLPALPKGWCWATVEQLLIEGSSNGISVKGGNSPPGVPALRLSAMSAAGFNYQDRRYIPISKEIADKLSVTAGDFFASRGNGSLHLVGRGTLAQKPPERIVFPDTMIRLRFSTRPWLRQYLAIIWESRHVRKQIERRARTTAGIYKISQTDIDHFLIPLPPTDEQRTIVESIDELVSVVDQVECQIQRQLARSTRLRQSILKHAFEGKLVPQDPTDEPASVLLKRTPSEQLDDCVSGRRRSVSLKDDAK